MRIFVAWHGLHLVPQSTFLVIFLCSLDYLTIKDMVPRFCILGIHASAVVALSLKPPQVIDLPSSGPSYHMISNTSDSMNNGTFSPFFAYPPSLLASNQSSSRLGRAEFQCDRSRFGEPSYDSCMDAYAWIPSGKANLRYGDRSGPDNPDILLPLRYSSST